MSVADRKVWCGGRQTRRAVHRVQEISRPDSGEMSGSVFEHIQKHPFVLAVSRHIPQACIDRVLRQQFLRKRVIENGMAGFEFRQKLTYACFKTGYIRGEQFRRSLIDALGPSAVINSGNVDVVGENQLLYGSQNLGALFRIQASFQLLAPIRLMLAALPHLRL